MIAGGWIALVAAPRERARFLAHWRDQLSAVADDRKAALDRWVFERFADATVMATNPDVSALAGGAATMPPTAARRERAVARATALLDAVLTDYGYRSVLILDRGGRTLLARGAALTPALACPELAAAAAGGQPLTDACLYAGTVPVVEVAAPIYATSSVEPSGVVVLIRDPVKWLYPFLQHQAVLSETAETLLVRRVGAAAEFITPLRHRPDPPMTFRRPLDHPGAFAATLAGQSLLTEAHDYRGVTVLAATRPVAGVPWAMIVKVDRAEALAGFRQWLRTTYSLLAVLAVGLAGVGYGLWHRERRLAQEGLLAEERRLAGILENAQDAYLRVDLRGRVSMASSSAARMYGYDSGDEMVGMSAGDLYADPAERESVVDEIRARGRCHDRIGIGRRRDGSELIVSLNAQFYRNDDGEIAGTEGFVRDITERRRAEEALRVSEERYRMLFLHAPVGVLHYDATLHVTECNDRLAEILGSTRDRLIGLDINALRDTRVLPAFRAVLDGEFGVYEGPYRPTTGSAEPFATLRTAPLRDQNGTIIGGVGIVEDITDRRLLEEQLRQAQKMEAVGHLAGGVAHDFNNLLQVIASRAHLFLSQSRDPEQAVALLRELEQHIGRGAALTRQLLLFSRRETTKREPLDLNDAVRDATEILLRLLRANISLAAELASEPLPVEADRGQLQQVLMNLTLNAADAMPDGGRLVIRTAARGAAEVCLTVEDTGHGIPMEIRHRIFEPFFTTKEPGQGTGLGLSVVHGAVASHGGRIEVESTVGKGTTFRVVLPRGAARGAVETREAPETAPPPARGAGERVLVVEDEVSARDALRDVLVSLGYRVTAVGNGEEAAALSDDPPFELLLTDVMLPGSLGPQVADELTRRWPALRVILMSGYANDESVRRGVTAGRVRFLQKPFDIGALTAEVRAALDERPVSEKT